MGEATESLEPLPQRVARLERQNRLLMLAAGVTGGGMALFLAMGAAPAAPAAQVLRVQGLVIVDGTGKERADFGMLSDGGLVLRLRDAGGEGRAAFGLLPDGRPYSDLRDAGGERGAQLGLLPDGSPYLRLRDAGGQERAALALGGTADGPLSEGSPYLRLRDAGGQERAMFDVLPDASSFLTLGASGPGGASLGAFPDGSAGLILFDAERHWRAWIRVDSDGAPALRLRDGQGNQIWSAP